MVHKIFAVYDSKAQCYTPPYFQHQEAMAVRTFTDCCQDPEHTFGKHPEDYTLFDLGQYDDSTGTITQDKIVSLFNGLHLTQE